MNIHPTAIIEDGAQLGADCVVQAHAVVTRFARLGDGVVVHPGAVIGGDPQDLKFDPATISHVRIGAGTVLRENVTVNRSTTAGGETVVGAQGFLMAGAHVAHNCAVGDHVVLANNVLLAGHVSVGAHTFVGGGAAFHQFTRVGESAMVGGLARITLDIPPFVMAAERDEIVGLNLVGLKRRGFSSAAIMAIKRAYKTLYRSGFKLEEAQAAISAASDATPELKVLAEFLATPGRGIIR